MTKSLRSFLIFISLSTALLLLLAYPVAGNLLLNTGPLPDGSIHPEDVQTLREVGRRIRAHGWPTG